MIWEYIRQTWSKSPYTPEDEDEVDGKVVVITGSNSGIGKAAAFEIAKRGATLVMACRDCVKGQIVLDNIKSNFPESKVELVELDLGDLASVRKCADHIKAKYDLIHILINNAGISIMDGNIRTTKDGFELHMGTNHLGHFLLTMLLLDLVKKAAPSRIINVSSSGLELGQINLEDLMLKKTKAGSFAAYANSKLANVYFTRSLAKRLEGTGVTAYALCPGVVNTDITRGQENWFTKKIMPLIALTSEQGAETILYCSLSKKCAKETGKMYRFCKLYENTQKLNSMDDGIECELWKMSEELVKL